MNTGTLYNRKRRYDSVTCVYNNTHTYKIEGYVLMMRKGI